MSDMKVAWHSAGSHLAPKILRGLGIVFTICFAAILLLLFIRSILRLEMRWDAIHYHLPFAALRAGLDIPYQLNEDLHYVFQGFPPLADLVQGILWRLTGSIHATGCINIIAFATFLLFCQKKLKAPFWLVAMISLTAPLVLIHTTVSYIDLFGNSFLAIGLTGFIYLFCFEPEEERSIVIWGLLGLIAAAWSKFMMSPFVALMFVLYILYFLLRKSAGDTNKKTIFIIIGTAALIAALPYLKNLIIYGNPFWPIKVPLLADFFPFERDIEIRHIRQLPPPISYLNHFELFLHSLFEINHPTHYPHRPRWIIDQGNAWLAFRMGGFWQIGVAVFLTFAIFLPIICKPRKGLYLGIGFIALIVLLAYMPQSYELRYYMFLPLCWAAIIGMFYRDFTKLFPRIAVLSLLLFVGLFAYMVHENWSYYQIERISYHDLAQAWEADKWWSRFELNQRYCAVNMEPIGLLLTGPTMREYTIFDRRRSDHCPPNTIIIRWPQGRKPY